MCTRYCLISHIIWKLSYKVQDLGDAIYWWQLITEGTNCYAAICINRNMWFVVVGAANQLTLRCIVCTKMIMYHVWPQLGPMFGYGLLFNLYSLVGTWTEENAVDRGESTAEEALPISCSFGWSSGNQRGDGEPFLRKFPSAPFLSKFPSDVNQGTSCFSDRFESSLASWNSLYTHYLPW